METIAWSIQVWYFVNLSVLILVMGWCSYVICCRGPPEHVKIPEYFGRPRGSSVVSISSPAPPLPRRPVEATAPAAEEEALLIESSGVAERLQDVSGEADASGVGKLGAEATVWSNVRQDDVVKGAAGPSPGVQGPAGARGVELGAGECVLSTRAKAAEAPPDSGSGIVAGAGAQEGEARRTIERMTMPLPKMATPDCSSAPAGASSTESRAGRLAKRRLEAADARARDQSKQGAQGTKADG